MWCLCFSSIQNVISSTMNCRPDSLFSKVKGVVLQLSEWVNCWILFIVSNMCRMNPLLKSSDCVYLVEKWNLVVFVWRWHSFEGVWYTLLPGRLWNDCVYCLYNSSICDTYLCASKKNRSSSHLLMTWGYLLMTWGWHWCLCHPTKVIKSIDSFWSLSHLLQYFPLNYPIQATNYLTQATNYATNYWMQATNCWSGGRGRGRRKPKMRVGQMSMDSCSQLSNRCWKYHGERSCVHVWEPSCGRVSMR